MRDKLSGYYGLHVAMIYHRDGSWGKIVFAARSLEALCAKIRKRRRKDLVISIVPRKNRNPFVV